MSAQYDALADLAEYEFTLLFRNGDQGNAAWTPQCPARIACEFLPPPTNPLIPRRLRQFFNGDIRPVLDRHNFDALILHGLYDSSPVRQAQRWCKAHRKPYILRCDANVHKERSPLRRAIMRPLLVHRVRGAAALLHIGRQNRLYYELYGATPEQFFFAPWEIDYDTIEAGHKETATQRDAIRREFDIADRVAIVTVARLIRRKGFDTVVDAVARLTAAGAPVTLLIAGEGPYRRELQRRIDAAGAPARLLGNLNRQTLVRLLAGSDVFVLASLKEPWALVVNEAALVGMPLVCSDAVGAAPDLIIPGENGDIFPAGDVTALTDVLRRITADPALRAAMGASSQEILRRWRTECRAIDGYAAALRHVLGPVRSPRPAGAPS